jgi:hypothetical protein
VAGIIRRSAKNPHRGPDRHYVQWGFGGIYEKLLSLEKRNTRQSSLSWGKDAKIRLLLLLLLTFREPFSMGSTAIPAADSADKDQEGFKIGVEVNMVTVPVTVRKQEGGFLKGLSKDAFHVYEDGEPQETVFFAQEGLPVRIAIVLDSSGSVRTEWGTIKYATKKFVGNLKPDDEFSIVSFNTDIRLKMDWGRKVDRIDSVLSSIYCKDNTKLWDASWVVSNDVFKNVRQKKP